MSAKTQIVIGRRHVGMPLTETQGALVLRWLDSDGVMEALRRWLCPTPSAPADALVRTGGVGAP